MSEILIESVPAADWPSLAPFVFERNRADGDVRCLHSHTTDDLAGVAEELRLLAGEGGHYLAARAGGALLGVIGAEIDLPLGRAWLRGPLVAAGQDFEAIGAALLDALCAALPAPGRRPPRRCRLRSGPVRLPRLGNHREGTPVQELDLFVIGGGSGGVRAARMAGSGGARVALAESGAMGGTCVNLGCIPKKLYSYAAHYAEDFEDARGYGWSGPAPAFDWPTLKRNRAIEILHLNGIYEKLLVGAGVAIVRGRARLADAHTVEVDAARFRARNILVATGGAPVRPEFPGAELAITSNEIFDLEPFPRRLLVLGGGYIACEFASIFCGLGSEVTLLYRGEQVLRSFDDDVRSFVAAEMAKKGVALRLQAQIASLRRVEGGLQAMLADGSEIEADVVLAATGRRPSVAGLGLEAAGVRLDERGAIAVDDAFRTSVPHIYAVGDVIDRLQLTPVALAEAMVVVDRLFGSGGREMDYEHVPTAVFTHPNIGTVGLGEAQARAKYGKLRIYRTDFKALKHTLSGSSERTLMKLVVDDASDRVVGLHMVGADAGEIVQGFAVALKAGATKAQFDATIGIHPTAAEEFVTLRTPVD